MASSRDNDAPRDPAAEAVDALLIGALYDELSPGEQRDLSAHLARASADGGADALEQLTTTRTLTRVVAERSQFFAPVDPPSSLSAMLMQEAARRRAPAKSSGLLAWLGNALRSVGRHPAMASAAAFAVVGVVVGGLYLRGQGVPVEQTAMSVAVATATVNVPASSAAAPSAGHSATEGISMAPTVPATTPPAAPSAASQNQQNLRKLAIKATNEANGFTAQLDDTPVLGKGEHVARASNSAFDVGDDSKASQRPADGVVAIGSVAANGVQAYDKNDNDDRDQAETRRSAPAKAKKTVGDSIEVTTAQPDLKTADGDGPAGAGAGASVTGQFAQAPVQSETSKDRASAAPAPQAAQTAKPTAKQGEDTAAASALHDKLIALNTSGNCDNASRVERSIADRYPRYYANAVESDSRVSPCRAEVARKRAEETTSKAAHAAPAKPAAADAAHVKK